MKDINLRCKCGCEDNFQIVFRVDDDEDYAIISTLTPGFYAHQTGILRRMMRRMQAAWLMLMGKEYYLHEVVLSKEQWNNFVKELKEGN